MRSTLCVDIEVIMRDPIIAEQLVDLYLRLNGYFTSGLIFHSPLWGESSTEIDRIGVRHPHHKQNDRGVESSPFLNLEQGIVDCVICEVKTNPENIHFNSRIFEDSYVSQYMLNWIGIFPEEDSLRLSSRLQSLFRPDISANESAEGIVVERVRFRALLCCPVIDEHDSLWGLFGNEIFSYLNSCFNPNERRQFCSNRYNFNQWGYPLSKIVRAFKDGGVNNFSDLSSYINAHNNSHHSQP
jgi:hypothetical protein